MANDYDVIMNKGNKTRRFKKYKNVKGKTFYQDVDSKLYYSNLQQNINQGLDATSFSKKTGISFGKTKRRVSNTPVKNTGFNKDSYTTKLIEQAFPKNKHISDNKYSIYFHNAHTLPEATVTPNQNNTSKRSDLATNKNKSTKQNTKTPENNYVMRRDNYTTAQPKTIKKNTVKPTNTGSTATPKRTSSRISSSTPDGNYTVNRGDSLWRIAHNNGISLNELMRQNPQIKNINQIIHPGDKINVRGKNDQNTSVPSTPKYEDIILDDKKITPTINTAPSSEQITPPDRIAPISYNYKKKRR